MRTRMVAVERLERIARDALIGGYGRIETFRDLGTLKRTVVLEVSMDCEKPVHCELHARYSATHGKRVMPITVVINSRCRKCGPCKERKRMFWAARAMSEFSQYPTTYFGTLTFAPERDAYHDAVARVELSERGIDFDQLDELEKFRQRTMFAGRDVTDYIKRLRAGSVTHDKPSFRYLMVAEAHASGRTSSLKHGRPHFHCLLHMVNAAKPLVQPHEWARRANGELVVDKWGNPRVANDSFLKTQWKSGHSAFYLCRTPQAAAYVCKYVTEEDCNARVRCSFRYGHEPERVSLSALPDKVELPLERETSLQL